MLLLLQPLAIAAVGFVAVELIEGTRWLAVFAPLLVLLVVWLAQAIHAQRRALELGAKPGGEMQIAAFLPLALVVVTAFWLVGGRQGSPAATVEAYMQAWMDSKPEAAAGLFAAPTSPALISVNWATAKGEITRVLGLTSVPGAHGGQRSSDPSRPFRSLRTTQTSADGSSVEFEVEIVRSERYETTIFGFIPTAAQRTVVVQPLLTIELVERPDSTGWLPDSSWRIEEIREFQTRLTSR